MMKSDRDAPTRTRDPAAVVAGPSPLDRRSGEVLAGKYLLIRPLGAGGMGQVWLARNLATQAEVAAKVLLPERAVVGEALERFRREAQTTASLWHRGIVRVFDLVELDHEKGSLLLVMELLHGQTLAQRLEQAGKLAVNETVRVLIPILSALNHAHRVGVVHRDLKPDNVFLAAEPDGEMIPKLVDFGISKMRHASSAITARGALIGTPFYMSPEQARGDAIDERSDIFAVGILLYECLSGSPPFGGQTLSEVVKAITDGIPAPIEGIPPALQEVIVRALAKRAEDRYATAADLSEALAVAVPGVVSPISHAPGPPSMTSVPPAVSRTTTGQPPPRARGAIFAIGALVTCAACAGLGVASLRYGLERPAPSLRVPASSRALGGTKKLALERDVVGNLASKEPSAPLPDSVAPPIVHHHAAPRAAPQSNPEVVAAPPPPPPPPARDPLRDPGF